MQQVGFRLTRVGGKIEVLLHTANSMTLSPDGKWMWDGSNWIPAPPQEAPDELIEQPVVETQPEPTAALPAGRPSTSISATTPERTSEPVPNTLIGNVVSGEVPSATTSTSTFEWESWMSCIALSIVLLVAAFIVHELAYDKADLANDHWNADCYIGDGYNGTYDKECQSNHDRIADDLYEKYRNLQAAAFTLAFLGIGLVVVGIKFKIKPEGDIKIWLAASSIPAVLNALTRIGAILF